MSRLNAVYRRTVAGQRAAIERPDLLSDDARRVLLLLNGITPLDALLAHGSPLPDAEAVVRQLLSQGLIEAVPHP